MVKILLVLFLVSSKVFADKITCIAEDYQECEWGGVPSLQCKEGKKYSADSYGLNHSMSKFTMYSYSEYKKPKFLLLENVKGLTFKTHEKTFNKILSELDRIGYDVFWKVLNSKNFGTPQNRERVFFVCTRKDLNIDFEL